MLKIILIALILIVVVFVIVVATRPSEFLITRSVSISAPAPLVFAQVNDFHRWAAWSPWAKLDPTMKQTFDGPPAGVGANYHWTGDAKVGQGRMTIVESRPNDLIRIKLEFQKPFAAINTADFSFKPEGDQTAVTWTMTGHLNFLMKAAHLVMNMDRMVGGQFEQGLAQMKSVAEEMPKP